MKKEIQLVVLIICLLALAFVLYLRFGEDEVLTAPAPVTTSAPAPCDTVKECTSDTQITTDTPADETPVTTAYPLRYSDIIRDITPADIDLLAAMVYREAGNQSSEGQQAVVEVTLNRVLHPAYPNTIYDVLYQTWNGSYQYATATLLASTDPMEENYDAVMNALYGQPVLDSTDVVFFSCSPENGRIAAHIGDHWFCREYIW